MAGVQNFHEDVLVALAGTAGVKKHHAAKPRASSAVHCLGLVMVRSLRASRFTCRVFDLFGRLVQENVLHGPNILPFQKIMPGTYTLQILGTDGRFLFSHKVVKTAE